MVLTQVLDVPRQDEDVHAPSVAMILIRTHQPGVVVVQSLTEEVSNMGILKTHRILVKPLQPIVCKRCWARPAVNSVYVGPTEVAVPFCQPCTNRVITEKSAGMLANYLWEQGAQYSKALNHARSEHNLDTLRR